MATWDGWGARLDCMDDQDAKVLLLAKLPSRFLLCGVDEASITTFLRQTLGPFPLAIKLAALYMEEYQCSAKSYSEMMHKSTDPGKRLYAMKDNNVATSSAQIVESCCKISKEKLKKKNRQALSPCSTL